MTFICGVGMLMLVIPTQINKTLKTLIILYIPLNFIYEQYLTSFILFNYVDLPYDNLTLINNKHALIRNGGSTLLTTIFFILVFIFAYHEIKKNNRLSQPQQ